MASFTSSIPPLIENKSLVSGTYPVQSIGRQSTLQYESPAAITRVGNFTSNIGTSNIGIPLNGNVEYSTTSFLTTTSNIMCPTTNFNIIKLDIDNSAGETDIILDVYYATENNFRTSKKRYTTIIERGELFYRNYPVENQFFNFTCRNPDEANRAKFKGRCSLSRYTQFNTPTQINDRIDRFTLGDIARVANNYEDDVLIGRIQDVLKTDRLGITDSITATKMTLWNNPSAFNFTSNSTTDIVARSTSGADNMDILITGKDALEKKVSETITLNGTSNVSGILSYKVVDDIVVTSGATNSGDVVIARATDGEIMNVMNANAGRSTSMIYTCPENTVAIIREFSLNGFTTLNTESKVKLYKVQDNERVIQVYQNNTRDAQIIENQHLEIALQAGETLFGEINSTNITSNLGDSFFSSRVNILEYSLSTEKII